MAVAFKALATAGLGTAAALIYSPVGVGAQIDDARVTNTDAAALTVSIWRVSSGAAISNANIVLLAESIAAGATARLNMSGLTLEAGQELWALATTGGVAVLVLSGREH